ncbi:MAG: hypothetical protein ABFC38_01045 [Methanospirillum sp.]
MVSIKLKKTDKIRNPDGQIEFSSKDNETLKNIDRLIMEGIRNDYLKEQTEKSEGPITNWVADRGSPWNNHIYMAFLTIYIAFGSDSANYLAQSADDPDYEDIITPPAIFIIQVLTGHDVSFFNAAYHGWDHYYNPEINQGNALNKAVSEFNAAGSLEPNNWYAALAKAGRASHYFFDLSNPLHTGHEVPTVLDQGAVHFTYESWVYYHMSSDINNAIYSDPWLAVVNNAYDGTRFVADYSHDYEDTIWEYVAAGNLDGNTDLENTTLDIIIEASRCYKGVLRTEGFPI